MQLINFVFLRIFPNFTQQSLNKCCFLHKIKLFCDIINSFKRWKGSRDRKPTLLKGARSKDYEDALMWLEDAGMIYRVFNVSKPGMPLSAYQDTSAFKVYACDCGLLRRLAHLPATIVTDPVANYTEFKGAMAENAVLQSLMPALNDQVPCYWTSDATAEVEFVVQKGERIIPVEVKAEDNISGNSLSEYNKKYHPDYRIRFSMQNLQFNCGLLSCPSPLAGWLDKILALLPKPNVSEETKYAK